MTFFELFESGDYLRALDVVDEVGLFPNKKNPIRVTTDQYEKNVSDEVKQIIEFVCIKMFLCFVKLSNAATGDRDRDHYLQRARELKLFCNEMCARIEPTAFAEMMRMCDMMCV